MTRLEEQLSLLVDKMDQQSEQLQQQQTEHVDSVVHRLDETSKHIDAVAGDLDSVKSMRLDEVESSFTNLKVVQEELGERQKILKAELRDELLHELTAKMKSTLRPTAPPFVPASESPGDNGGGDTLSVSADHESNSAGRDATTPGSGEGGTEEAATVPTTEERGSTVTHGRGSATIITPSSVQRPAPFDGKLTWDAYHT